MSEIEPDGFGPDLLLRRGDGPWRLEFDTANPGLYGPAGPANARLLAMQSVATVGRCDDRAFDRANLVDLARHRGRVEAIYRPPGWEGLQIRAAWSPAPSTSGNGFDLEVQVHATTARVLERLEVGIVSSWGVDGTEPMETRVEPRDLEAAGSTYDGRESPGTLHALTTLPIPTSSPQSLAPTISTQPGAGRDTYYVEMIQPNDCARRILREPADPRSVPARIRSTRYALFGHDLEKGVVLRARLRGLWIHSRSPERDALASYESFLGEPPALGP